MKIIAIGDLHGKDCWRSIKFNQYDKVVFIGDYTDSFVATNRQIFDNLLELIELKQSDPEKFILLLGNHDAQYLYFPDFRCTGFRPLAQTELTDLLRRNKTLFQVAFQYENYLFTHAGVSQTWLVSHTSLMERYHEQHHLLGDALNAIHRDPEDYPVLHDVGILRGGISKSGGIFWADQRETNRDYLKGVHQVAGHTPVKEIKTLGDDESSITYIDVLDYKTEFYEVSIR